MPNYPIGQNVQSQNRHQSVYKNMEKVTNFRTTLLSYILLIYFEIIYAIELNPGEVDGFYLDISASGSQHKS